jgi:ribosomal protein L32
VTRRLNNRKSCTGKRRINSHSEAKQDAKRFRIANDLTEDEFGAYRCLNCGKWHIGHTPSMLRTTPRRVESAA